MSADLDPDLKKLSDRKLADMYGRIRKSARSEEKRLETVTKELDRRGKTSYRGLFFDVQLEVGEQRRFDSEAAKIKMGEAWYDAHKKLVTIRKWVLGPEKGATPAA